MTEKERQQVLFDWNATQAEFLDICVHQLFEQQVSEQPDAIALIEEGQSFSYRELNKCTRQLCSPASLVPRLPA